MGKNCRLLQESIKNYIEHVLVQSWSFGMTGIFSIFEHEKLHQESQIVLGQPYFQ